MITSTTNPRVRALARLRDRRGRLAAGAFPVEGARLVHRVLAAGWAVSQVVVAPGLAGPAEREAVAAAGRVGVPVLRLGVPAFRKIAYRRHPDGVLAVVATRPLGLETLTPGAAPLLLVAERIEKPGNLGAMLRTADGAGVDAVIAADPGTDPYNPNVVRASLGALFDVPLAVTDPARTREWLATAGIRTVAARPGDGPAPWAVDLTGAVAVVVGSEHRGLTAGWDDARPVSIPMRGGADSLNASTAAAVILYEAVRQRR